jgi:hypothetical protein
METVIGDMSFGEPFGCLQGGDYHEWVASIFQGVKAIPFVHLSFYLKLTKLAVMLTPRKLREAKKSSDQHAYDKVDRRIEKAEALTDRKDFLGYILKENDAKGMSEAELKETAVILIIAGSETTWVMSSHCNRHTSNLLIVMTQCDFPLWNHISTLASSDYLQALGRRGSDGVHARFADHHYGCFESEVHECSHLRVIPLLPTLSSNLPAYRAW